ncbi:MAG: hypothetical protein HZA17_00590 [Nitrospirae bacterium]|nr:hypothetical protein [Nitrospirota bacterium]
MIRRGVMLTVIIFLFVFTCWNFYTKALRYEPLSGVAANKQGRKEAVSSLSAKYQPAWGKEIHDRNLFNPSRSYREPKSSGSAEALLPLEPPKKPELVLKGIILDTFGEYVAYLEIDKAKAIAMRRGDKTDNIELVDISGRKTVLKWNDELIELTIDKIKTITNPRVTK